MQVTCYHEYMATLTYRTNLLLSEKEHEIVKEVAKKKSTSINQVIREAIIKTYKKDLSGEAKKRTETLEALRKISKTMNTKGLDYIELIEKGRRL